MTDMATGMRTDPESGASYYTLRSDAVARTVHISDLIMVDLGADDAPVGVEFAGSTLPNRDGWNKLFGRFPELQKTELAEIAQSSCSKVETILVPDWFASADALPLQPRYTETQTITELRRVVA